MSLPGWYPDPEDPENRMRYWDGSAWKGGSEPRRTTTTPGSPGWKGGWVMWVVLTVGVVAVALLVWSVLGRGLQPTTPADTVSTKPTGSAWDEQAPDSPSPSPTALDPSGGQQVPCPRVDVRTTSSTDGSRLTAAGLSVPTPSGGTNATGISQLLTDATARIYQYPGSAWVSFLSIGRAPASEGFTDPATTARQVIECHLTGGSFGGYESHEVLASEAVTVDGRQGHRVRIHAVNSRAPAGGALFVAVALDVGNPAGLAVYWGGAVDADANAVAMLDQAGENLQVA